MAKIAIRAPAPSPKSFPLGKILKWVLILMIGVGFWFGFRVLQDPHRFPIRSVQIHGAYPHLSEEELRQIFEPYWNEGFFGLQAYRLRNRLLEHPWLADVSIHRIWPDQIQIELREHRPLVRWGIQAVMSQTGEIFFPAMDETLASLPVLMGPEAQRKQLFLCYQNLRQALKPFGMTVRFLEQSERGAWRVQLSTGTILELGREQLPERFARFLKVYEKLWNHQHRQPLYVDLRYPNGMAVRYVESSPTLAMVQNLENPPQSN